MKIRRILSLALAVLLTASLCVPAAAFSDEPASWAAEAVEALEKAGLVDEMPYTPSASNISRGYFCRLLVRLVQLESPASALDGIEPVSEDYFADSPSDYYNMRYAAAYGLTEGAMQDGRRVANPTGQLTREQAAKFMCALMDALERYAETEPPQLGQTRTFADRNEISGWAAESVDRAVRLGILEGDEAGRFLPQGTLTWEQACVMVCRVYQAAEAVRTARDAAQGITRRDTLLEDMYAESWPDYTMGQLFLLQNGDVLHNSITQGGYQGIQVERYDQNGTPSILKTVPFELDICYGFYESETGYYLLFGQDNMEEDDSKEVYRIVRYDKNWNRLGAAGITGGESYTTKPYHSTSNTGIVEEDGVLTVHTARQRYLTSDGLRHQSNITIKIRVSDMTVLSCSEPFPQNHVSHSFAQYVRSDQGVMVYADQSDGYPERGFVIQVENDKGVCESNAVLEFSGGFGENDTNALPGGLGISENCYLFAGASSPQKGDDSLTYTNAFLAVVDKNDFEKQEARVQWLTHYPPDGQTYVTGVRLVELNNNTFVVMWQLSKNGQRSANGTFQYAVFGGQGNQIGETVTKEGFAIPVSDPVVEGNTIRWVRPEISQDIRRANYLTFYQLDITPNAPSAPAADYSLVIEPASLDLPLGETAQLSAAVVGSDGSRCPVEAEFKHGNSNAVIERDGVTVTAREVGDGSITATCTWRGKELTATCPVTVYQGEVSMNIDDVSLHVGEAVPLNISITGLYLGYYSGGMPNIHYSFYTTNGLCLSFSNLNSVTAYKEGTYTVSASFSYGQRQTCRTSFQVTVLP